MKHWRLIARLAATIAAVSVIAVSTLALWTWLQPLPSTATPEGTVLRYYRLMAQGRIASAQEMYAPELRAVWGPAPAFGFTQEFGLVGLTVVRSGSGGPDGSQGHAYTYHYSEYREVDVGYTQWFGDDVTTEPGGQFREVFLGRKGPESPWVILEMGTGG